MHKLFHNTDAADADAEGACNSEQGCEKQRSVAAAYSIRIGTVHLQTLASVLWHLQASACSRSHRQSLRLSHSYSVEPISRVEAHYMDEINAMTAMLGTVHDSHKGIVATVVTDATNCVTSNSNRSQVQSGPG